MNNDCAPGEEIHEDGETATCDPFDGYVLNRMPVNEPAAAGDTDEFTQKEANFALFFGLSVQAYEQLTIPDDTPWDKFNDQYPMLGNGVAQPGEQGTLHPSEVRELVIVDVAHDHRVDLDRTEPRAVRGADRGDHGVG